MNATRIVVWFAGAALACSAAAQQPPDSDQGPSAPNSYSDNSQNADPPARVARLGYLQGNVSFAPSGETSWVEAQRNRPLVTGDKLWADAGARAELDLGSASVRLDQQSAFDFLNLTDQTAQMELTQGGLDVDVRRIHGNETYEVDTPTLAFVADRVGEYRVTVDANGSTTTVAALRGGGTAYGEGGAQVQIAEGQALTFDNAQLSNYRTASVAHDEFSTFVSERVERRAAPRARDYVSEDVVGYEDLDDNGSWSETSDYGHVWYPSHVAADWAPYRDGHWVWVDPWGWNWVDDESWGFAPFHYGRWVYAESRWGWVPGPVDVRPVYAPALVAFVGGGGFGLSVSVGEPIGWFPLGPRDVYFPGFRCGRDYFTRINISNTRVINNVTVNNYYGSFARGGVNYAQVNYAYRNDPRAITAVSRQTFVSGQAVGRAVMPVNQAALARATIMPRAAVAPTRASVLAANAAVRPAPAAALGRQVVAAHTPPPARPSFAARQAMLQRTPGQPLSTAQMRTLGARTPQAMPNVRPVAAAAAGRAVGPQGRGAPGLAGRAAMPPNGVNARNGGFDRQAPAGTLPSSAYARGGVAAQNGRMNGNRAVMPSDARNTVQNGRGFNQQPNTRNAPNGRAFGPAQTAPNGALRSSQFAHANPPAAAANRNLPASRFANGNPPGQNVRGTAPGQTIRNATPGRDTSRAAIDTSRARSAESHVVNAPRSMPSTAYAPRASAGVNAPRNTPPSAPRFERPTPQRAETRSANVPQNANRFAPPASRTERFNTPAPHTEARVAPQPQSREMPHTVQRSAPSPAFERPAPRNEMRAPPQQQRAQVQSAPMPRNEMRAPPQQQRAQVQSAPMPRNEMRAPQPQYNAPRPPPSGNYAAAPRQAPAGRQPAPQQNARDHNKEKDHRE